jgi:hypothetical protein
MLSFAIFSKKDFMNNNKEGVWKWKGFKKKGEKRGGEGGGTKIEGGIQCIFS